MKTKAASNAIPEASKAAQAANKYFDRHEHIQEVAVILKEETGAWVSVHRREEGQLLSVDFPLTQDLEYAAQCLLQRFDVHRNEIVYA